MLNGFDQIKAKIKTAKSKMRVMLWDADDAGWLKVLRAYQDSNLIEAALMGNADKIRASASAAGVELSGFQILDCRGIEPCILQIKTHLKEHKLDILIRGTVGVKDSLKALFAREVGFRIGKNLVSSVSCHYVKEIDKILTVTDPVVCPTPDLNTKISLVNNAVGFARGLENPFPKVAMLAAVETVYPVMPHTIEAAAIAKMNDRGQIKGCMVDGPLSMDCAVIEAAAKSKGVKSEVGGRADILVAPTIETAYGMYKAFSRFVGAPSGVVVVGGKIPYCTASRSDTNETKEHSLLLAML